MKRKLSLALALLLVSASLSWAGARKAVPPPLIRLGGMLQVSIPAMNSLALPTRPAALDLQRPASFLQASRIEVPALPQDSSYSPRQVIASVNAVLKDFTPQAIEKMPAERLNGVAGLILDQMQAPRRPSPKADLDAVVFLSQARADHMLVMRGQPVKETLENPGHVETHPDHILVRGVPDFVRPVSPAPETVFRHYTDKESMQSIVESGCLRNGHMCYDQISPYTYKKVMADLTGVFLTLPKVKGDRVGRRAENYPAYIDLLLPPALPLFQIDAREFLIPLPGRTPAWFADQYRQWRDGGKLAEIDKRGILNLDQEGGPGPELEVSVKIVKYGRAH